MTELRVMKLARLLCTLAITGLIFTSTTTFGASMMDRWNHKAVGIQIPFLDGQSNVTLIWNEINNFPHPTFKGGSEAAYQKFAEVFVLFLEDEFSYLKNHHLFTYPLIVQSPNGAILLETTFEELSGSLAGNDLISAELRERLGLLHQRILEAIQ